MCSVRTSPIPSAPNSRAFRASSGVSALARTPSVRRSSAQPRNSRNSPPSSGWSVFTASSSTSPVEPSTEITSPSPPLPVHDHVPGADDAALAHPDRDHGRVRRAAPARGHDALGRVHAGDVLGRGLGPHQEHLLARPRQLHGAVGADDHLAPRGARRGRPPAGPPRRPPPAPPGRGGGPSPPPPPAPGGAAGSPRASSRPPAIARSRS